MYLEKVHPIWMKVCLTVDVPTRMVVVMSVRESLRMMCPSCIVVDAESDLLPLS